MQGILITFEGVDGSGKSTQATMLFQRLVKEHYKALLVREPGGTSISEKIRDLLLDIRNEEMASETELLLYAASRAQLVREKVQPKLKKGVVVICDRYTDSTLAYQGYGRGLNRQFIQDLNTIVTQEITPTLTYIIDVEIDLAESRTTGSAGPGDRLENEHQAFKQRVREGYHAIAESEPSRVMMLSGNESIDDLHEQIWEVTVQQLETIKKFESQ